MVRTVGHDAGGDTDALQQRLARYAVQFDYGALTHDVIDAAKVRVIDTLGALMGGFFSDACRRSRNLAARMPMSDGATVIGTRCMTTPDMAAFVNGTTARYVEMTDTYHWPGSAGGHPSDVITPVLAVAEQVQASGRDFIAAVVMAYEVYLRLSDVFGNRDFDHTNFCCLATAMAAGRLLGLSESQLAQCISMAVVPNNSLRQARVGHQTMWRAAATGQAGRAGVFAALLAREGLEGATMPFEGKAGWLDHVARRRFTLDDLGDRTLPFKILDTRLKFHPSSGNTMVCIQAAEQVAPLLKASGDVARVTVEVYRKTLELSGQGEHNWNPDTRESADHSVPFLVATTLMDGTVTPRSFRDARLRDPALRALMKRIEVVENPEFTLASESHPRVNRSRVTVVTADGESMVGSAGGDKKHTAAGDSDAAVAEKFRSLSEEYFGPRRVDALLASLWQLEQSDDVATLPPAFALD